MCNKIVLREELALRRTIAFDTCPNAGLTLATKFSSAICIAHDTIIAGYMPFRAEIDPRPLMRALAMKGVLLTLPRVNSPSPLSGRGAVLSFHQCDIDNKAHFQKNRWGLLEPHLHLPTVTPTILLVPLLGFDRQGNRLGYGKGYYDTAIADLRQTANITAIGLSFAQQEVEHIPTQPHDQRLDWIITQNEAYRFPS